MANGALIMIGIPIIIGLAAGMALYAVYQSWQEEENRNQYRNRPQNISQPNTSGSTNQGRNTSSANGNVYQRRNTSSSSDTECSICFERNTADGSFKLDCNHTFHKSCLRLLVSHETNTCPNCRTTFTFHDE